MLRVYFKVICVFILLATTTFSAAAQPKLLTFDDVKAISPTARDDLVQALIDAEPLFEEAGINTRLRMAHFLAQVMTETGGLRRIDENMNYSYATLLRVFSRRTVSDAKAREIAGDPVKVANWVYGARLGNLGRDTMDGWDYRGSGYIQLTGRSNFRDRGAEVDLPLEDNPEMARGIPEGLIAAVAYWTARDINAAADDHDRRRVRVLVNGPAAHGYEQSKIWFNRAWLRVFQAKEGQGFETAVERASAEVEEEAGLFDQILERNGVLSEGALANESTAEATREEALRAYQRELGLPETGVLDEATQEALLDPREWRHQEVEEQAALPEEDLDASVELALSDADAPEETPALTVMPEVGSGATVDNPNLSQELRFAVSRARAHYAAYEMGSLTADPNLFKPFSVIGDDDREAILNTLDFPARAIVQILLDTPTGRTSICTGSMISKDTVLTAAHCIHTGTERGQVYQNLRVIPGRNLGVGPFGTCGVSRAFVLAGWVQTTSPFDARYYDLGALKLDCEVGEATGWFGVRLTEDSDLEQETIVQGYAADDVEACPLGRQCRSLDMLRILWDQKGFYHNDTFGGTSGAPVFRGDAEDMVFGVHTNGLHGSEPWASNNAFTRITPVRLARVVEWIGSE